MKRGFTLIELLVVVAIIAILASIGLSNLMKAATRSRIAQVKGELHTLSVTLSMYQNDFRAYPPARSACSPEHIAKYDYCRLPYELTSPVEYIERFPMDPFNIADGEPPCTYKYLAPGPGWSNGSPGTIALWVPELFPNEPIPANSESRVPMVAYKRQEESPVAFVVWSVGPAGPEIEPSWVIQEYKGVPVHRGWWYSPTNGLRSHGVITRLSTGHTSP